MRFGEYPQMMHDLDAGTADLILTPQTGRQSNFEYTPFTKERIVLISGSKADTSGFNRLLATNDKIALRQWLKKQVWYTTAADMEHLKNFWITNFECLPDLKPNYVVPSFSSILRCLRNGNGFAVMPDFLCKKEIINGTVNLVWEGNPFLENTLHFGKRKKTIYANEIRQVEKLLTQNWS
jgi:DNA-binding transcriptional LysR family regulator